MATATDVYNEVLFSAGEEADFADVNELQRRFRSLIVEMLLGGRIPNGVQDASGSLPILDPEMADWITGGGDITPGDIAFAPFPGSGMIRVSATANRVHVCPGVMVQCIGDVISTGVYDPASCLVFVNKALVNLDTAVGDATNPRIDIVEMKLETVSDTPTSRNFEDAVTRVKSSTTPNKARRTKATFQIKQGTPSATPAYPACTAGYVPLGAVYVPATHNAVHTVANMRDLRWPLGGVRVYDVEFNQLNVDGGGGTPWDLNGTAMRAESPNPSTFLYAMCPGGTCGRVLAVGVFGEFPGDGDTLLRKITHDGSDPTPKVTLCDLQSELHDPLSPGPAFAWAHALNFMDDVAAGHGSRVAGTRIGAPIWNNGTFSGPIAQVAVDTDAAAERSRLGLEIIGDNPDGGTKIGFVRWVIAHGMS